MMPILNVSVIKNTNEIRKAKTGKVLVDSLIGDTVGDKNKSPTRPVS